MLFWIVGKGCVQSVTFATVPLNFLNRKSSVSQPIANQAG
jgi:hypothetical protein